ncbi:MAG TPA: hypothetical protein VK233_11460, partial [Candidatus Dormibacteraeota bacterium]|nr:hypothetical protein [Candidatus Dormibacteraeota bacterium]
TREHFLESLARDWPELVPRYERLYAGRTYPTKDMVEPVRREVAELRERFAIADRRQVRLLRIPDPSPPAEQLGLDAVGFGGDDARLSAPLATPARRSRIA